MLAFYGKKTNPRAGLFHDQGIITSKAIANIPTWMGYFTRWRVRCVSISEASEILAGCKRLEKESLMLMLQMLREHYCGSFMFREQRNMVKNLCQGAQEVATDFMVRVDSSVSNLAKDWKGQITEAELRSLQYEVSLNGVQEEI